MIYPFEGKAPLISETAYIAPGVVIIGDVEIGDEASVWFQSVVRADINSIRIGAQTNIQDGCMLHVTKHHSLFVGERVTVGHGAILHACHVGNDCLIAMGAIVLDGATIEDGCLVGAGTLVPPGMVVKAGSLVLGSPAKVLRPLTDDDKERVKKGWLNYLEYSQRFKAEIR